MRSIIGAARSRFFPRALEFEFLHLKYGSRDHRISQAKSADSAAQDLRQSRTTFYTKLGGDLRQVLSQDPPVFSGGIRVVFELSFA